MSESTNPTPEDAGSESEPIEIVGYGHMVIDLEGVVQSLFEKKEQP